MHDDSLARRLSPIVLTSVSALLVTLVLVRVTPGLASRPEPSFYSPLGTPSSVFESPLPPGGDGGGIRHGEATTRTEEATEHPWPSYTTTTGPSSPSRRVYLPVVVKQ